MKILITGSSGFIGSALTAFFKEKGYATRKLVRRRVNLSSDEIAWDPEKGELSSSSLEGLSVVIHLAGEGMVGRWTEAKKKHIRESRIKGTQLLCRTLCQLKNPPLLFICASAIGYYGYCNDKILTEKSPNGIGFLAEVCKQWEEAAKRVTEKGIRTIHLRMGVVLSSQGGFLKYMLPIFKLGLGGKIGPGTQYISWIAIDDLVRVIDYAINQKSLFGPLNAVAPYPVTNRELIKTLGHYLYRPTFLSVPTFMVNLIFGELGKEILLGSSYVKPYQLKKSGFQFRYPYLKDALKDYLN